jgi:excisionase family DNA binding protein
MGNNAVVELHQWYTVDELADREGVSTRTIYRKLERGEVEKTSTSNGARYRLSSTDTTDSHDTDTDSEAVSSSKKTTDTGVSTEKKGVSSVSSGRHVAELTDLVGELTEKVGKLERKVGQLKAENDRLRRQVEDTEPASSSDEGPSYTRALAEMMAGERTLESVKALKKRLKSQS